MPVALTEITLVGGERLRVQGDVDDVQSAVVSAARGSIMEFAWVIDAQSDRRIAVNPDHVAMLRQIESDAG